MEKRYITADSVRESLRAFEERFGWTTAEFYALHQQDDERLVTMPRRYRSDWASLYRMLMRMTGDDQVRRDLQLA
jgi:hypothetical protein